MLATPSSRAHPVCSAPSAGAQGAPRLRDNQAAVCRAPEIGPTRSPRRVLGVCLRLVEGGRLAQVGSLVAYVARQVGGARRSPAPARVGRVQSAAGRGHGPPDRGRSAAARGLAQLHGAQVDCKHEWQGSQGIRGCHFSSQWLGPRPRERAQPLLKPIRGAAGAPAARGGA